MGYKNSPDIVPVAIMIVFLLLWMMFIWTSFIKGQEEFHTDELVLLEENTLVGIISPTYENPEIKQYIYSSLLECLCYYESEICRTKGVEKCIGGAGEMGCMQFKPFTFQQYCIDKYHLTNNPEDIWNCDLQKKCADNMINEGLIYHWTTRFFCL